MRAILRKQLGGPDVLEIREMPEPERQGDWAEIADVSGIECLGIVKSCPGGEFSVGANF
jgi:NADPH:quinone reductase